MRPKRLLERIAKPSDQRLAAYHDLPCSIVDLVQAALSSQPIDRLSVTSKKDRSPGEADQLDLVCAQRAKRPARTPNGRPSDVPPANLHVDHRFRNPSHQVFFRYYRFRVKIKIVHGYSFTSAAAAVSLGICEGFLKKF